MIIKSNNNSNLGACAFWSFCALLSFGPAFLAGPHLAAPAARHPEPPRPPLLRPCSSQQALAWQPLLLGVCPCSWLPILTACDFESALGPLWPLRRCHRRRPSSKHSPTWFALFRLSEIVPQFQSLLKNWKGCRKSLCLQPCPVWLGLP